MGILSVLLRFAALIVVALLLFLLLGWLMKYQVYQEQDPYDIELDAFELDFDLDFDE